MIDLMTRRTLIVAGLAAGALGAGCSGAAPGSARPAMIVHKDPNCGCCKSWAEIAHKAGYPVRLADEADMAAVKTRLGVPAELASCHTTEVGGLLVEGHVPLDVVDRVLRQPVPGLRGLAVPGMPAGSPGMEMPDGRRDAYQVVGFFADGRMDVLASIPARAT